MDRIHASASNPNLVHSTSTDSSASKSDCPSTAAHEIRIQEIRLRENFIGTAENGWYNAQQKWHLYRDLDLHAII